MKHLVAKDKKNRFFYKKLELKRLLLKSLQVNKFLDRYLIKNIFLVFIKLRGMRTKIKNYCIITNRSRGIIQNYKISRILFKKYASFGYLKGIKKSSW